MTQTKLIRFRTVMNDINNLRLQNEMKIKRNEIIN